MRTPAGHGPAARQSRPETTEHTSAGACTPDPASAVVAQHSRADTGSSSASSRKAPCPSPMGPSEPRPGSSAGERHHLSAPTAANSSLLLPMPGSPEAGGDGRPHPRHQPPSSPPDSAPPHDPGEQEVGGGSRPRLTPGDPELEAGWGRWRPRAGCDGRRDRELQCHQERERRPTSHAHAAPAGGSCHSRGKIMGWNFPPSPRRFPGGR